MRVALVSADASPLTAGGDAATGQAAHVAALARALAHCGVEVTVHARRDAPGHPERVALCPGVDVHHVTAGPARPLSPPERLPLMGMFGSRLDDEWAARRPDIVHAHGWRSGLAALAAARPHGLPVVQSFHALGAVARRHHGADGDAPPERVVLERGIMREASHIIASSREEAFDLAHEGADRRRLSVVPSGVDTGVFAPAGPREYRVTARPRAVYAGGLSPRTGIDDAVRAVAMIPEAELVIAGGPPRALLDGDEDARRLRALIAGLGTGDRVQLRGRIDPPAVATIMRSADVVVCTPWCEPLAVAPLEAMACGTPVVAASAGGINDAVVDGVTGMHVPPRDPRALADALGALFADGDLRARMGAAGVRRVAARHTWERVGRATARAYGRVVAARSWAGHPAAAPAGAHAGSARDRALAG